MGQFTQFPSAGHPVLSQLMSFIPKELVNQSVAQHQSDRYYKVMTTYRHLVFLMYGVVSKARSLNELVKGLSFLSHRLSYLGINALPATSTLSDANSNRKSEVFATLYAKLYEHYKELLTPTHGGSMEERITARVHVFDSTTISLFCDVFKGVGRNPLNGKRKGGIKAFSQAPLEGQVPDLVVLDHACTNEKAFLGQLQVEKGDIYIFDKGFADYRVWSKWDKLGASWLTRLNENATFQILKDSKCDYVEYADGGLVNDQKITLAVDGEAFACRLITYRDPESGKTLRFATNLWELDWQTVAQLYKYRWGIEVLFKRLKQNFQLTAFFSDSAEGIKTQIWIALIANLIFTVIHRLTKEAEVFSVMVRMAAANMASYISLIAILKKPPRPQGEDRNLKNVQLSIFEMEGGGTFQNST
jgi:hypothetical protein